LRSSIVFLAAVSCITLLVRGAFAQGSDVEAQWRALDDAARLGDALDVAKRAEKAAAPNSRGQWLARVLEADTLDEMGETDAASALYGQVDRGVRATLGADDVLRGRALLGEATLLAQREEMAKALPIVVDARRILTPVATTDPGLLAAMLEAIVRRRLEQTSDALAAADRSLALARSAIPPNDYYVLRSLVVVSFAQRDARDFAGARSSRDDVVTRLGTTTMTDVRRADVLFDLALLAEALGDEAHGLDWARTAVDLRQKAFGPNHFSVGNAENERGTLATELDLGAEAVDAFENSLRISRLRKTTAETIATEENNIGTALASIGRFIEAEAHLRAAESTLGGAPPGITLGTTWGNLGWLDLQRGYYQGAKRWLERSRGALSGPSRASKQAIIPTLAGLSQVSLRSGRTSDALELEGRALTLAVDAYGPDSRPVATELELIAESEMDEGRWNEAVPLLRRSIEILTNQLGADHTALINARTSLATCLAIGIGTTADANDELGRAVRAETHYLETLLPRARPADIRRLLERDSETTSLLTWVALKPDATADVVKNALGAVLTLKALDLDIERTRARTLRSVAGSAANDLLARLAAARAALARVLLRGAPTSDEIGKLGREIDRLELEVSKLASMTSRDSVRVVDPMEVAKALPPHTALVELSLFKPFTRTVQGTNLTSGGYHIAAFVLLADGTASVTDLGGGESIGDEVTALRAAVQSGDPAKATRIDMYSLVVAPWQAKVAQVEQLFVAPDGPLTLLPFEILERPDGTSLLDTKHVSYLTSGRDLLDLRDATPLQKTLGGALLVGDPDYDFHDPSNGTAAASPGSLVSRAHWPKLPGTGDEVRSLSSALPGSTVLVGSAASVTGLAHAGATRIVHLATHGFFLDPHGGLAAGSRGLVLDVGAPSNDAKTVVASREMTEALSDQPLIRSGLIFAGANVNGVGADDGYLTAAELESLDMGATDLIVLSACETAVGDTTAGLGVMGLRRSLALAGVRSQVMSLWKVDDAATAELMKQFYASLGAGASRVDALRSAKLAVASHPQWSSPGFWGAFQLFGDWRPMTGSTAAVTIGAEPIRLPPSGGCGHCTIGIATRFDTPWGIVASIAFGAAYWRRRRTARAIVAGIALGSTLPGTTALAAPPNETADAMTLNTRGAAKGAQGNEGEALTLFRRAIQLEPDNDFYLANAASACLHLKDYKAARGYFDAAVTSALTVRAFERVRTYTREIGRIAISERPDILRALEQGAQIPLTGEQTQAMSAAEGLIAEANAMLLQGSADRALATANQAIAVCTQKLPKMPLCAARARTVAGVAATTLGDATALQALVDAVGAMSTELGKDHPEVLVARLSLASAQGVANKRAESIATMESVVADATHRFGVDNPYSIGAQANLVDNYAAGGRPREAIALALRTLEPCRRIYGKHNEMCGQLLRAIARAEYTAGHIAIARGAAAVAMKEQLEVYGSGGAGAVVSENSMPIPEQPAFIDIVDVLTRIELGSAKPEPINVYRARLKVLEQYVGREEITTLRTSLVLAQNEIQAGQVDVAARRLLETQRRVAAAYGESSPTSLEISMFTATQLARAGKLAEIEKLSEETNRHANDALGPNHETSLVASFNDGFVKAHLGRAGGYQIAAEAAARAAKVLGATSPLAVYMHDQLTQLPQK
jgi:CHAT domain-containing protein/tetratricopeptide (TPR) repeat protein